ncbi:26745_t:CDS:2 [Gigaspora margarita]|uniref:26745_t:CDS:1 n=1 Tax=Gigaspora margarita TaxID=4874 RepID=A0ABN7VZ64_GIGMA|nr:26745_t:CDS:2 [Gigaspora margarita]
MSASLKNFSYSQFISKSPKMIIINLNCLISGSSSENKTFTIEISNDKKYELLKHMVKKCLAPLFDSIPSTQITLRSSANGPIYKPMVRISKNFANSPDKNGLHIYVDPQEINFFLIYIFIK